MKLINNLLYDLVTKNNKLVFKSYFASYIAKPIQSKTFISQK